MYEFAVVFSIVWDVWIEIASVHAIHSYPYLFIHLNVHKSSGSRFFFVQFFLYILCLKRTSRNNKHENTSYFLFREQLSAKKKGGDESCVFEQCVCCSFFSLYIVKFFSAHRMTPNHNVLSMNIAENVAHIIHFDMLDCIFLQHSVVRARSSGRGASDNGSYAITPLQIAWIHKDIKCVIFCGRCLAPCSNKHFECTGYIFFFISVVFLCFVFFFYRLISTIVFCLWKTLRKRANACNVEFIEVLWMCHSSETISSGRKTTANTKQQWRKKYQPSTFPSLMRKRFRLR